MITQLRTETLSKALLPAPKLTTYAAIALLLGLMAAAFEALFPQSFSFVSPFSWSSVLTDGAKNLGIVLGIAGGLAYASHLAKGLFRSQSTQVATVAATPTESSAWTELLGDAVRIIAFSFLITIFARISIDISLEFDGSPVPLTGQTLAVLLTGAVLGARLGLLATLAYLCQGMAGMNVFAGGAFGLVWQFASGGYIIGFVAAAFLVGFFADKRWNRGAPLLVAMLLGNILLYIPGLLQLGFFVPWEKVLYFGLYPFIITDLAKLFVASLLVPGGYWVLTRYRLGERPAWT